MEEPPFNHTIGQHESVHVHSETVHVHDGTAMTSTMGGWINLDFLVGSRKEKSTVYGYVYEYVYGEDREIRTTASSGRAKRPAAGASRSPAPCSPRSWKAPGQVGHASEPKLLAGNLP
jgi:hypothetical protein